MNEQIFLSEFHENPGDEATWLALADWLEEDGQSDRAELVRCVRRLRKLPVMEEPGRATLEGRMAELLRKGVRPVVPEIVINGMRLALIEPGTFRMGSPSSEPGRGKNERNHVVTLTRPFYLAVFAVTQLDYFALMEGNPSCFCSTGESRGQVLEMDTSDFPVEQVTWDSAVRFCEHLSNSPHEKQAGRVYRLPTEAEWEYACRAGTQKATYLGAVLSSRLANFNGTWPGRGSKGPYLGRTCPVGSYLPNAFGLYDMLGNVWEWCSSRYERDYPAGPVIDPQGASDGQTRVSRGGGSRGGSILPGGDPLRPPAGTPRIRSRLPRRPRLAPVSERPPRRLIQYTPRPRRSRPCATTAASPTNSARSPSSAASTRQAAGSVLVSMGRTVVLCTCTVEESVPPFLLGSGKGWLTAEYSMLPGSTNTRKARDRGGKVDGRSVEIQRLIGRALRAVVNLDALGERTLWIDCDVLDADGGTRTASINGAFVALADALAALQQKPPRARPGQPAPAPVPPVAAVIRDSVAAVSVGLCDGAILLDLCYVEDKDADVDLNLVMTGKGELIEVQAGGEEATFSRSQLDAMLEVGAKGVADITRAQRTALAERWPLA